jgi:hypothetical protein
MAIAAVITVGFIASSASAALDPYASVRLWLGYEKYDSDSGPNGEADMDISGGLPFTGTTRFGMKGEKDGVMGKIEFGFKNGDAVSLREAYAETDAGGVKILIGQTYQPYNKLAGNNVADDQVFFSNGAAYEGRKPQLKLTFADMFYVDLIASGGTTPAGVDALIPKTAVGIMMPVGPGKLGLNAVYQTYKYDTMETAGTADDAFDGEKTDSWMVTANFSGDVGAKILFNFVYGSNVGDMGIKTNVAASQVDFDNPTSYMSAMLAVDVSGFNVGFAYESSDQDAFTDPDTAMAVFAAYRYKLKPNFTISPAIYWIDKMDDAGGNPQGTMMEFGLHFQADL